MDFDGTVWHGVSPHPPPPKPGQKEEKQWGPKLTGTPYWLPKEEVLARENLIRDQGLAVDVNVEHWGWLWVVTFDPVPDDQVASMNAHPSIHLSPDETVRQVL